MPRPVFDVNEIKDGIVTKKPRAILLSVCGSKMHGLIQDQYCSLKNWGNRNLGSPISPLFTQAKCYRGEI